MTRRDPIPTLRPIVAGAAVAARRFPLALMAGLVAAVGAVLLVEDLPYDRLAERLLVGGSLGLPLFVAARMMTDRRRMGPAGAAAVWAVAGLVLLVVGWRWAYWSDPVRLVRYIQLSAAFHLLAAIVPVTGRPEPREFWEYNRALFERAILSALYTVVIFAGLALALAAVDRLFGVEVSETGYARLWVTAAFVFNTWVFVGGLPDPNALDTGAAYPPGLKVFAQYILLPIVAVYLVILTAYFAKVVVTWEWPSGWIGWLVSGVAVVGILALLLVHPVSRDAGNRWVTTYARGFFAALLPPVVMLWLAVGQRVGQYGITEPRYFLLLLSIWLGAIAVQQLVTRSRRIEVIPVSLCAVAVLTVAGPWGAYRVSERSQVSRLEGLLRRHGMLVEGRARPAPGAVPAEDRREISAVLRYLAETHDYSGIADWFGGPEALGAIETAARPDRPARDPESRARLITARLAIDYVDRWESSPYQWFDYTAAPGAPLALAAYDSLIFVRRVDDSTTGVAMRVAVGGRALDLYRDGAVLATFPLDSLLLGLRTETARPSRPVPADRLWLEREAAGAVFALQLYNVQGRWNRDSLTVSAFTGAVLVGKPRN